MAPDAGVEPALGEGGGDLGGGGSEGVDGVEVVELLGVALLDHAEAAELALGGVVGAVVVGEGEDLAVFAGVVGVGDAGEDLDGEVQAGGPGASGVLVGEGGGCGGGRSRGGSRRRGRQTSLNLHPYLSHSN